jgi:hypothetical protein
LDDISGTVHIHETMFEFMIVRSLVNLVRAASKVQQRGYFVNRISDGCAIAQFAKSIRRCTQDWGCGLCAH